MTQAIELTFKPSKAEGTTQALSCYAISSPQPEVLRSQLPPPFCRFSFKAPLPRKGGKKRRDFKPFFPSFSPEPFSRHKQHLAHSRAQMAANVGCSRGSAFFVQCPPSSFFIYSGFMQGPSPAPRPHGPDTEHFHSHCSRPHRTGTHSQNTHFCPLLDW